jgi:hypothetical protein
MDKILPMPPMSLFTSSWPGINQDLLEEAHLHAPVDRDTAVKAFCQALDAITSATAPDINPLSHL